MPRASQLIISVGSFLDQIGGSLTFTARNCYLNLKRREILVATRDERGLYTTCMSPKEAKELTSRTAGVYNALGIHAQILRG